MWRPSTIILIGYAYTPLDSLRQEANEWASSYVNDPEGCWYEMRDWFNDEILEDATPKDIADGWQYGVKVTLNVDGTFIIEPN